MTIVKKLFTFKDPNIDRQMQEIAQKSAAAAALPPAYATNADAITGGLKTGDRYRTGGDPDLLAVVHDP